MMKLFNIVLASSFLYSISLFPIEPVTELPAKKFFSERMVIALGKIGANLVKPFAYLRDSIIPQEPIKIKLDETSIKKIIEDIREKSNQLIEKTSLETRKSILESLQGAVFSTASIIGIFMVKNGTEKIFYFAQENQKLKLVQTLSGLILFVAGIYFLSQLTQQTYLQQNNYAIPGLEFNN